jgi:hypothetical protein
MKPKTIVLSQLVLVAGFSFVSGMFFMQGFENWLQSNPLFWPELIGAPFFLVLVILYCRNILKTIP